ncbi:MAG: nucleotidyltransferase domain-containing protein [Thermovenabulum sp.]|uniref:nucleotidyltransferase domain-containing protein n=1 Tax=Thermovenabulum sp. TaxID=3100335 RepID=UPI003C7CA07F
MPVRSLNSSVLKWPDDKSVILSLKEWVEGITKKQQNIVRIGYFGSYARGDWGVGSDLDIIVIIDSSETPFHERSVKWDVSKIPVPVDLLVYTMDEFERMKKSNSKFYKVVDKEVIWVYP